MPGLSKNLKLRILSALVLAPLSIFCIYMGGIIFYAFLLTLFCISLYEWMTLSIKTKEKIAFIVFGALYLPFSFLALFEIQQNLHLAFLLVLMVWASDIGGYVFGKFIGGPKMAVKISPNKTWAGMAGAILAPYIVFQIWVLIAGDNDMDDIGWQIRMLILSALFGIACQAGDLLVSFLKRRAGEKDTGTIIPGHGGLLDRIDSLLMGGIVVWLVVGSFARALY